MKNNGYIMPIPPPGP